MIRAFRFIDNVQHNISRCVQVNKYRDCYDICYTATNLQAESGLVSHDFNWLGPEIKIDYA